MLSSQLHRQSKTPFLPTLYLYQKNAWFQVCGGLEQHAHLEPLIIEGCDTAFQFTIPLLCLGQLGGQVLVDCVQLGVVHRLLEQLLLHLPPQLLQSCYLHALNNNQLLSESVICMHSTTISFYLKVSSARTQQQSASV